MAAVKNEGKSGFARDVLARDSTANAEAINAAWKEAGQEGTITDSLVQKIRSEMRLSGNLRPRKGAGGNGAAKKAKPGSSTRGRKRGPKTKTKTGGRARG